VKAGELCVANGASWGLMLVTLGVIATALCIRPLSGREQSEQHVLTAARSRCC